jgi:DNA mismatch endonuclease, patch repair protein
VDTLTPEQRSERMGRVRNKDTRPELRLRRLVFSLGYRYRLHYSRLPGRPDLVFPGKRKVIFVHGCFWHRHEGCPLCRLPKSRLDFWKPKLEGNKQRDVKNQEKLREMGWGFLVVWECELRDTEALKTRVKNFLEDNRR